MTSGLWTAAVIPNSLKKWTKLSKIFDEFLQNSLFLNVVKKTQSFGMEC